MPPLAIEVWSDVVCPWCYLGKRRLEAALEVFDHRDDVTLTWRSFELDPAAARELPGSATEALAAKYGMTIEEARASHARMTELAAQEGLEYRFDRARRGNSFDAHRLIHAAAAHGIQDAAQERLMRAYFTEGVAIGDPGELARIAAELGLDPAAIEGGAYADAVRADEELAQRIGIRGVPYFVLNRRYGVSGAQPAEMLLQALEKAWDDGPRSAAA